MDSNLRRMIDGCAGNVPGLMQHVYGGDAEAANYATRKLIEHYAAERKHGALLELYERENLAPALREMAGLAIVGNFNIETMEASGKAAPKQGILDDLAFDRGKSENVRIAAGKMRVDILLERMKKGDPSAKAGIEKVLKHGKYHKDVKDYARNALDAFELAMEKARGGFKGKRGQAPNGQPRQAVAAFIPGLGLPKNTL